MPTQNVACPYCGSETLVTVPKTGTRILNVKKDAKGDISASCAECGKKFVVNLKK